jgi:hypothetical protein
VTFRNYKTYLSAWEYDIITVNHYEPRRLVLLGTIVTISLALVFGSVLLSPSVINVALGVNMPDAPVTQDTVTAGKDEDEDNDEGNDQPDSLPDPEDAPVTTETITSGNNDGSKEGKGNEENNNGEGDERNAGNNNPTAPAADSCPKDQERMLFEVTCTQLDNENTVGIDPTNSQSNECVNDPLNVGCQNTASQIQGDDNTAALSSEQAFE